ncbi:MAG: hypothetical protein AB1641_13410 [Thermodesulfobacteriota bacterium]
MSLKRRIAFILNSIIALVGFVIGASYLAKSEITSYHKQVIGVDWAGLVPGVQKLLIILMKGTGDAAVVTALALAFFLIVPFRRGENWSRWAILTVGLAFLLPMLFGSIYLASTTGASSPWWLNATLLTFLLVGFFLPDDLR